MDLLELLTQGKIDDFNAQREPGVRLDFFGADLAGANLAGANLSGANLQKADLSGATLTDAELTQTDLSGADLTGTNLQGIMGMRSRWRDAYLGEANLTDADLVGADLTDADLTDAAMSGAMLSGARLKRAILVNADLSAADLAEARLTEADLTRANLHGAQLREADLSRSVLESTTLTATDMTRARLTAANASAALLDSACLMSADLSRADLTGASVNGTDFTRADFTEAVLENVDLSKAITDEAELPPGVVGSTTGKGEDIESAAIYIDEPQVAVSGSNLAVTWENPDRNGKPRLRVATGKAGRKFSGKLGTLPVPADLAVSNSVVPHGDGFTALTVLERPGGTSVNLIPIARDGSIGPSRSLKLGYTPIVRPMLRNVDGHLHLFGISRQGPTVVVHRIEEDGLNPVFGKILPTARGFVGGLHPYLLSKGGVLMEVGIDRLGEPMRVPAGFPGRVCVACPTENGVALAWIPSDGGGFRFAIARPGIAPEVTQVLPKEAIRSLDAVAHEDGAWIAFTREAESPEEPASAWAVRLPDGKPQRLTDVTDGHASSIHVADSDGSGPPMVGVTTTEGALGIYALKPRSTPREFHLP